MLMIVSHRRVELRDRKVRMLQVHFLRRPAVGEMIQHDLNDLDVGSIDPRASAIVAVDMWHLGGSEHVWRVGRHRRKAKFGKELPQELCGSEAAENLSSAIGEFNQGTILVLAALVTVGVIVSV